MKMFGTVFKPLGDESKWRDLYPTPTRDSELVYDYIYSNLNNGVYKAGVPFTRGALDVHYQGVADVFACLDMMESRLSRTRYIIGQDMTFLDIRILMTLLRFDTAYYHAFGCTTRRISSYPHISSYCSDMYSQISPETTVDWESFYQYYRWSKCHPTSKPLPSLAKAVPYRLVLPSSAQLCGWQYDSYLIKHAGWLCLLQVSAAGITLIIRGWRCCHFWWDIVLLSILLREDFLAPKHTIVADSTKRNAPCQRDASAVLVQGVCNECIPAQILKSRPFSTKWLASKIWI